MNPRTSIPTRQRVQSKLGRILAVLAVLGALIPLPWSAPPPPARAWPQELVLVWSGNEDQSCDVAWGDWDNDGDLDLAVGFPNWGPVRVYANDHGVLTAACAIGSDLITSLTWGDWDGDGDLDLAVGNGGLPNRVYRNDGGSLTLAWSSVETDNTRSVAWGDWDGDGDLDLAVGNDGQPNRVYRNDGGSLTLAWSAPVTETTTSLAWGDWDSDGDLDLAVGNWGGPTRVYANSGGSLTLAWSSLETDNTFSVAWGDWDNDGDLDLATTDWGRGSCVDGRVRVYANGGGGLTLAWSSIETDCMFGLDWGDWDGDGDLDLAVVGGNHNRLYHNSGGNLTLAWTSESGGWGGADWGDWDQDGDPDLAVATTGGPQVYANGGSALALGWSSAEMDKTCALAWGDWDHDGDLDLAAGNDGPNRVYANNDGTLAAAWSSAEADDTRSLAWGDWDNDGDLDLAVGNAGQPNRVYRNDGGSLTLAWSSAETDNTRSVAWGDWDGDGDLDLAVGNAGQPNRVYRNDGGSLTLAWSSAETDNTRSVAWGDWDQDGDLDLAVGNDGQPNRVYCNAGGSLALAWSAPASSSTRSVAWGDCDRDGDLDLAVGNWEAANCVYRNDGGSLALAWSSAEADHTTSLAWGDWDGDGDLDLAVGNYGERNRVYASYGDRLLLAWSSAGADGTWCVALGDADNDGDLDLAAGTDSYQPIRVYTNSSRHLSLAQSTVERDDTRAAAWADWDRDGNLDLAVGNYGQPNRLYRSDGGKLVLAWSSVETDNTTGLAWGDWDNDGDLDLAVGNDGQPNRVYRNTGGSLALAWSSVETDNTTGLAWGDWDGDGDLDLAVGNAGQPNRVYRNDGGSLTLAWSSAETDSTTGLAWGDWDQDGDLDLAVGNDGQPDCVYRNDGGSLTLAWSAPWDPFYYNYTCGGVAWGDWDNDGDLDLATAGRYAVRVFANSGGSLALTSSFAETEGHYNPAWGDWDGDGDLDLAVGGYSPWRPQVFANSGGSLALAWSVDESGGFTQSVAWGDWDGDGDLDLAVGNSGASIRVYRNRAADIQALPDTAPRVRIAYPAGAAAPFFSSATILQGPTVAITYTLVDPESDPVRYIQAYYSLDGGSTWRPAVAASGTPTTNLTTSPAGTVHVYTWDVYASGIYGSSDTTVFRIDAYQGFTGPGPYQYPARSGRTLPFRLRGSQVRVLHGAQPAENALVYRLPAGQTGAYQPYRDTAGQPLRTDAAGYLRGWGHIAVGDRLVALAPQLVTDTHTLYYTNATPTLTGLTPYIVTALGVQNLVVSPAHPLILFNLDVSLEWDARTDKQFLSQLEFDLQRTAELLYDWTNGQAALGHVTIYHDRAHWNDAHVRIYATNRLRPNAAQGGITTVVITDPLQASIFYAPGQVRMGAVWNRYGDPGGALGEDWPRTLAHELGHYAFFLDDDYLGFANGLLVPVETCSGTAMSDPYRDDYSEFHPTATWLPGCQATLSHQLTGRSDWETITTFYPWLHESPANPGPSGWPLAATEIQLVAPVTPTAALAVPVFYLSQDGHRVQPGASARAFLFRQEGDWLTDLGRPTVDQVLARGARPGDRIAVYELAAGRLGYETITAGDEQLALVAKSGWQPEVTVSPVTSRTINLTVANVPAGLSLWARLFPVTDPAPPAITLTATAGQYAGAFHLAEPALEGYVQVWVDEADPRREIVTDYALGGDPGYVRGRGGYVRGRGGYVRGRGAPAMSADGQVILFGPNPEFTAGEFYALQAATVIPSAPAWATVVGQAYRLSASAHAPDLAGTSLSFSYLGSDVPPGEEGWLRVCYWNGSSWQRLPTQLDTYANLASAPTQGPGLYALMSSVEIPLYGAGWNLFAYPVQATRPVTEALLSISGYYTTVYGYDATDTADPWKVYDVTAPDWVNDLHVLQFGRGYWINCTEAITLLLKGGATAAETVASGMSSPPATYYGAVQAGAGFTPTSGLVVTAGIDSHPCGQGRTLDVNGQVMYVVDVFAEGPGGGTGCGAPGRTVLFRAGTQVMVPTAAWDNERLWGLDLAPAALPAAGFTTSSPDWLGQTTVFTNSTQTTPPGDPTVTYQWAFGDGVSSTLANPTHVYATPGFYTVVLTATNLAGPHVVSGAVTIYGPPAAGFTTSSPDWLGQTTVFTNSTQTTPPGDPTVTYQWAFGDGASSTLANPTHVYATPGIHTVALTATNPAGAHVVHSTVTVYGPPTVGFTAYPTAGLSPLTVIFTNTTTTTPSGDPTLTHWWDFGDGGTSALVNPTHTYTQAGVYTVTLTVSNAAGNALMIRVAYITVTSEWRLYLPLIARP